jgi:hypothetical protein
MGKVSLLLDTLKPGDIFCTHSVGKISSIINAVQKIHSHDNEASYSHTGIIINKNGETLESLWTVRRGSLDRYLKKPILIGRHEKMNDQIANTALKIMSHYEGKHYPVHRLFFHLIPPVAKIVSTGKYMVCSELVSIFLFICRAQAYWKGITPDHIADMIRHYSSWKVIYEGVLSTA